MLPVSRRKEIKVSPLSPALEKCKERPIAGETEAKPIKYLLISINSYGAFYIEIIPARNIKVVAADRYRLCSDGLFKEHSRMHPEFAN